MDESSANGFTYKNLKNFQNKSIHCKSINFFKLMEIMFCQTVLLSETKVMK